MIPWEKSDIELYSQQFDNLGILVGKSIDEIVFYLKPNDIEFTEQPNSFGKSLFNSIDIKVENTYYSIGCRFIYPYYGLTISQGRTLEFEFIEEKKSPMTYSSSLIGKTIKSVDIYWMKIPLNGAVGYYPQEFVIKSENEFFLLSSIEVNRGEVNTAFTNELLIIENEETAKQLKLGHHGLGAYGREWFKNFDELHGADKKNWL